MYILAYKLNFNIYFLLFTLINFKQIMMIKK